MAFQQRYDIASLPPPLPLAFGIREILRSLIQLRDGFDCERHAWTWAQCHHHFRVVLTLSCIAKEPSTKLTDALNSALEQQYEEGLKAADDEYREVVQRSLRLLQVLVPEKETKLTNANRLSDYYKDIWLDALDDPTLRKVSGLELQALIAQPDCDIWSIPLLANQTELPDLDIFLSSLQHYFVTTTFWEDWFRSLLNGKPLDWNLQRQIALIPHLEWLKGPENISQLIDDLVARHLAARLPLSETIAFNEDTNRFHAIPAPIANPPLLGASLTQVADALEDVLADPSNGLHDRSREVRVLQRTLTKYGNDPQRIEMDFTSLHAGLTRQIVVGELPPSEELLGLQHALEEGAQAIRATHPDVADNRRIVEAQKIAEMTPEQKALLAEAQPMLEAITEGALQEDFATDIPFLLEDRHRIAVPPPALGAPERNPALAGQDEIHRAFGRSAQIGVLLKKVPKIVQAVANSTGFKAASILLTLKELVKLGLSLITG